MIRKNIPRMKCSKLQLLLISLLTGGLLLSSTPVAYAKDEPTRPLGWTAESHSDQVEPNYEVVFPEDQVNVLTITITPERWEAMQANMTELFSVPGQRGGRGFGGPMPDQAEPPAQPDSPLAAPPAQPVSPLAPPEDARPPVDPADNDWRPPTDGEWPPADMPPVPPPGMGMGGGFGGSFTTEKPMWVTATIEFDGNVWTNVGVRYKGNSSLRSAWSSGSQKLPLKLDFDEFEDQYPEIKNQRFYGFKQLSLANGVGDTTFMRDAISYQLLEEAGLVAAKTAFYEIHLDYGEGPVNLGLYTAIEVIDDTVIERHFGNDKGNIYEAEGRGASLAVGTFDQIESSFQKENNKTEADWSDIEALYEVLHDESRLEDPEAWRAQLEEIFDVDTFLRWLALSASLQHWDTYGAMPHNFYLYHHPKTDQLIWISWDHNFVLGASMPGGPGNRSQWQAPPVGMPNQGQNQRRMGMGGFGGPDGRRGGPGWQGGPGGSRQVTFDRANTTNEWPLIRYLLDDPIYAERYQAELQLVSDEVFDAAAIIEQYEAWAELLAPYVEDEAEFDQAVASLVSATERQAEALKTFLSRTTTATEAE